MEKFKYFRFTQDESTMNSHHMMAILSLMHEDMCSSETKAHKLWG